MSTTLRRELTDAEIGYILGAHDSGETRLVIAVRLNCS
jgi:hypothetical protein